jgi:hypothetical protein
MIKIDLRQPPQLSQNLVVASLPLEEMAHI